MAVPSHLTELDLMIVPITPQEGWQTVFIAAKQWEPPRVRTIFVAPHPDDESLATGGLIAALISSGVQVQVITVTDGENAYVDFANLRDIRRREQEKALQEFGVTPTEIVRLGLPDSDVTGHETELINALSAVVTPQTHVIAPWPKDFHPDHEACGRAAKRAAESIGAQLTFYFFWTWHRGTPSLLEGLPLRFFQLSREQRQAKRQAIQHHQSQLVHSSGDPILPDSLLWPARLPFELFLPQ
jgi:LmbE family N-acetylglucosaminyl deacetylase